MTPAMHPLITHFQLCSMRSVESMQELPDPHAGCLSSNASAIPDPDSHVWPPKPLPIYQIMASERTLGNQVLANSPSSIIASLRVPFLPPGGTNSPSTKL